MDVVELAPGMCPAGRLIYMVAVEMMEARIGVSLQGAVEVLQMLSRMFSSAVFRIGEPDSGSGLFVRWSVVANISPKPSSLGLAVAGRKHRHGRIVSMKLATGKDMLADGVHQRTEQIAGCTNPSCHGRARNLDSLTGIDLRLPEQRQMIRVLRDDHMCEETRCSQASFDRP